MKAINKIRLIFIVVSVWGIILGFSRNIPILITNSVILIGITMYFGLTDKSERR